MTEQEWLISDDPQRMLQWVTRGCGKYTSGKDISDRKLRLFACACCRQVWPQLADERSRYAVEVAEQYADGLADDADLQAADVEADRADHQNGGPYAQPYWAAECCTIIDGLYAARALIESNIVSPEVQAALLRDIVGNPWQPVQLPVSLGPPVSYGPGFPTVRYEICPWRTRDVIKLAEVAYEERPERRCDNCEGEGEIYNYNQYAGRIDCHTCHATGQIEDGSLDPTNLAVLADCLEETGCQEQSILKHLRGEEVSWEYILRGEQSQGLEWHYVGWIPKRGPCVRGCWVLDLLLGKE